MLTRTQRPELSEEESIRLNFIAANAVLGVVHTMLYDPTQTYTNEELAKSTQATDLFIFK